VKDTKPLLTIELENENSVPKVFYKGEEIKNKIKVGFNWDTANDIYPRRLNICIDYVETNNVGEPVIKGIHKLFGSRSSKSSE
jgi:hypothetical protein